MIDEKKIFNCLVVEDDSLHFEKIERHIQNHPNLKLVGRCKKRNEIMKNLESFRDKEEIIDLLLLDINLGDNEPNGGIDFMNEFDGYKIIPPTIITTAHLKVDHATIMTQNKKIKGFLDKPIRYSHFKGAIDNLFGFKEDTFIVPAKNKEGSIVIKFKHNKSFVLEKIDYNDIIYISTITVDDIRGTETDGTIRFFTKDKGSEKKYIIDGTLKGVLKLLNKDFIQIYQKYIINKKHIEFVYSNYTKLKVRGYENELNIGRTYKDNLPEEYLKLKENQESTNISVVSTQINEEEE